MSLIIAGKEISDIILSKRFTMLFILVSVLSILSAYSSATYLAGTTTFTELLSTGRLSQLSIMGLLAPLIGIALGFDAINRERESGSMIILLSYPIYRDDVLNGKFIAGLSTIALMLITSTMLNVGFIMAFMGIAPRGEEIVRLIIYILSTLIYTACFLSISIFLSIKFSKPSTSLLASIVFWISTNFVVSMIASSIASLIPNLTATDRAKLIYNILLLSIQTHYNAVGMNILNPMYAFNPFNPIGWRRPLRPLSLIESINTSWPSLAVMISLSITFIALSYISFLREEVR